MNWDAWTVLVLGLAGLSVLRPAWAVLTQQRVRPTLWRRKNFERAGGGATMLTVAIYLVVEARPVIGRGFWDLVVMAVHAPFMRLFPAVWVPALCWVLLVVLGLCLVFQGAKGSRGPRDTMAAVWAVNEIAIFAAMMWWHVYVPDTWSQATLLNFGIRGLYVGFLAGAIMRFVVVMLSPSFGAGSDDDNQIELRHWLGRFRRY